jgi:hypothetical protein
LPREEETTDESTPPRTDRPPCDSRRGGDQELDCRSKPDATFDVFEGEDPCGIYLQATVDIEDSSDALTPALDKLYELEVEQELPIYVVTSQPAARIAAQLQARAAEPWPSLFHLPT